MDSLEDTAEGRRGGAGSNCGSVLEAGDLAWPPHMGSGATKDKLDIRGLDDLFITLFILSCCSVAQLYSTVCDPMNHSL